jgi:hypothetical protein
MIRKILKWFEKERQWHRDHVALWQGWTEPTEDGLSRLQHDCEEQLVAELQRLGSSVKDRSLKFPNEEATCIHGHIENTKIEVWIYSDTACFTGPRIDWILEEWDFRAPEEFIQKTVGSAIKLLERTNNQSKK